VTAVAPKRTKVAVLGGGPAAIAAAFELTAPELGQRFEVTVYQRGWRLGGKCASGRNRKQGGRIEEHGLHVWFGFYDSAFRMVRAALQELDRPPEHPLATFEQAFEGCDRLVLHDRQGCRWHEFPITFPRNDLTPGDGTGVPDFWDVGARLCGWAIGEWQAFALGEERPGRAMGEPMRAGSGPVGDLVMALAVAVGGHSPRGSETLLRLARRVAFRGSLEGESLLGSDLPTRSRDPAVGRRRTGLRARLLARLLTRARDCMWEHRVEKRGPEDPRLRLFFTTFDTLASAMAGIVADRVQERGWTAIDDLDLCEWLARHGAKEVTVGSVPGQRAPVLKAIYDLAFAYPGGDLSAANAAAGTAMSNLLRLLFSYRGSVLYRMRAGMGDTVIAPMYELLARRGVTFNYFNSVTDLRLSGDGRRLDAIEVVPQVELMRDSYDPLIPAEGLSCWPSEPLWEQLRDGGALSSSGVNFELESNPLRRSPVILERGRDYDEVVLGIPVGALPEISTEIVARHPRFARMVSSAETVATQAFQLWLTRSPGELGWMHGPSSVAGASAEGRFTWCDMSYLLAHEGWQPEDGVRGLAYFCGVLDDRRGETCAEADRRVKDSARSFLEEHMGDVWPGARPAEDDRSLEWRLLADPMRRADGARLDSQYWRANTAGSERYVLTPAGTVRHRLAADESGVDHLLLAGDWTRNGIDGGCVEAAIRSGTQAARALIKRDSRMLGDERSTHTLLAPEHKIENERSHI
jgi:uncharacterized protein with NAD-binding domain and iron-sulfur cluster